MQVAQYNASQAEAVAVFHAAGSLQSAIDELLVSGFDHAELSVLASEKAIIEKLGRSFASTTEFKDDPDVPRMGYIPDESVGDAKGAIIGAAIYLPAIIGSLAVVSSGGTMLGAIAVAALAGGAGGAAGSWLASYVGKEHARHVSDHLQHGGLLLWVRTQDAEHEEKALAILRRHGGEHVHLHVLPRAKILSQMIKTRRPLLSFGPPA
jgi:hypothetical protein